MVALKELENQASPEETERFLKFNYPEVKDLLKHEMTIMSGVTVFAATFGEKVVKDSPPWAHICFGIALCLFLVGLIVTGRGLYVLYMAAEKANGPVIYKSRYDFRLLAQISYSCATYGEFSYILGLVLLVVAGASKYFI